jgi:hypothetical protein
MAVKTQVNLRILLSYPPSCVRSRTVMTQKPSTLYWDFISLLISGDNKKNVKLSLCVINVQAGLIDRMIYQRSLYFQGIRPHVSSRSSDHSTQLGHLSHLDSRYHSRSNKTTTPSYVDDAWKLCFYVGTRQRICLFSDDLYSDSTVILTTIAVK